jgi:hypothetical protein
MGIPVIKVFTMALRMSMRPINNLITKAVKTKARNDVGFRFFVKFGRGANLFESKIKKTDLLD